MRDPVKSIVLLRPYVTDAMRKASASVLSTRYIGQGPRGDDFERAFSRRMSDRATVAVSSCSAALYLAYLLSEFKTSDNVLVPVFTCTAANEALLWLDSSIRPQLRFVDVAPNSLNMDATQLSRLITTNTKAIAVVHYGGMPVDKRIFDIADNAGIPVIEDCAHALGTDGVATRGRFACFSFQAVKELTTCDGGMLVLPESLRARAKRLRWFGIDREAKLNDRWNNDIVEVGYKFQMTDDHAAMGIAGLHDVDAQTSYRRRLRETYRQCLEGVDGIQLLDTDPQSACWLCTVFVARRQDLRRKLAEAGIESNQVHYRNDRYTIFRQFVEGDYPNMDAIESRYLVLPMHMGMTVDDVHYICDVIKGGW